MEKVKKLLSIIAIFAIIIGMGCGIGMNFYHHEYVAGVCCIILSLAAVPTVIRLFNYLRDKEEFPLEVGDEFTTDKGEHLRVIGFLPDGTPKCEYVEDK